MDIREIKLYDCVIDTDFKENKNGCYDTVAKAKIGKFENIVFLELDKEEFEYINQLDYKNTPFNIKGHMQVKVNKKGLPFIYFKANFIMSVEEVNKIKHAKAELLNKIKNQEKNNGQDNKQHNVKDNKQDTTQSNKCFKWEQKVEELGYEQIEVDTKDIVLKDKEHLKNATINFSKKYLKYDLKVAIKKIENSDKYELILGWKSLIGARMFDKKLTGFVVDVDRKELLEKIEAE